MQARLLEAMELRGLLGRFTALSSYMVNGAAGHPRPAATEVLAKRASGALGILVRRARAPGAPLQESCGSSADLSRLNCHAAS